MVALSSLALCTCCVLATACGHVCMLHRICASCFCGLFLCQLLQVLLSLVICCRQAGYNARKFRGIMCNMISNICTISPLASTRYAVANSVQLIQDMEAAFVSERFALQPRTAASRVWLAL
jgi:hypothetical protein